MKASLQTIYDELAETYDSNRGLFNISDILDSFYAQLKPEQGSLLDLGCGAGEPVARYFIDQGWDVTGVDFSQRMLQLALNYVPEMRTINSDMLDVDFDANQFDAVTATYSLFHIPATAHAELFEKMHRWLCPGGKALFTYATSAYTGSDEFDGYKKFMDKELYYSHKTPENLYAVLKQTGFSVDSREYLNIGGEEFLWVTVKKA
jgi:cyclopropane fatty-acyl-phospholipid synthase-like methyltransferase